MALLDRGCRVRPVEAQAEAEEAVGVCEDSKSSTWPGRSREKARGTRHPQQNRQWALPLWPSVVADLTPSVPDLCPAESHACTRHLCAPNTPPRASQERQWNASRPVSALPVPHDLSGARMQKSDESSFRRAGVVTAAQREAPSCSRGPANSPGRSTPALLEALATGLDAACPVSPTSWAGNPGQAAAWEQVNRFPVGSREPQPEGSRARSLAACSRLKTSHPSVHAAKRPAGSGYCVWRPAIQGAAGGDLLGSPTLLPSQLLLGPGLCLGQVAGGGGSCLHSEPR